MKARSKEEMLSRLEDDDRDMDYLKSLDYDDLLEEYISYYGKEE